MYSKIIISEVILLRLNISVLKPNTPLITRISEKEARKDNRESV